MLSRAWALVEEAPLAAEELPEDEEELPVAAEPAAACAARKSAALSGLAVAPWDCVSCGSDILCGLDVFREMQRSCGRSTLIQEGD